MPAEHEYRIQTKQGNTVGHKHKERKLGQRKDNKLEVGTQAK